VDNDESIRETARFLLEDEGYEVIEAPDGAAALDLLCMSDQPMVVLDIVMPRLSGVELLKLVGRDERLTRHAFVVWTASRVPVPTIALLIGLAVDAGMLGTVSCNEHTNTICAQAFRASSMPQRQATGCARA